jgi:hypothetical protein
MELAQSVSEESGVLGKESGVLGSEESGVLGKAHGKQRPLRTESDAGGSMCADLRACTRRRWVLRT